MSFTTILSKIAPELEAGLAMTGPFGALGAMALKAVSAVVDQGNGSPTLDSVQTALAGATPEQMLELQKVNNDFKLKTQAMNIDVLKIQQELAESDAADRASARAMAVVKGIAPQLIISGVFIGGYFGILVSRYLGWLHADSTLDQMMQTLLGGIMLILNFWFGSTHGSQQKDATLAQVATSP